MRNAPRKIMALALALALLLGCAAMAEVADGTYTGTGTGNHGDVVVETTFEGGVIKSVVVTEQVENPDVAGKALTDVPAASMAC